MLILGDNVFGYAPGQLVAIQHAGGYITEVAAVSVAELAGLSAQYADRVQDCRGLLVLPGLIDAHVHAIATGMAMLSPQVNACSSLEEVEAAIQAEVQRGREFIRITGLDLSRLSEADRTRLDRRWLEEQSAGRALFIKSVEGHSGWFNAAAWEQVGVGTVLRRCNVEAFEQEAMFASGRVYGKAYEELTTPLYDSYSAAERREAMRLVQARALEVGLVGLHCLEGYGEFRRADFQMMLELDGAPLDLTLYCRDATPALALELGVARFGGCWCVDGAIGAHTAAISTDYLSKPGSRGELYFTDEQLSAWMRSGLTEHLQICVHAIGDRALDQALRALEGLAGECELRELRPRVDHFVCGTPQLGRRAAAVGAVSAMQPAFDAFWGGSAGGYALRLGAERALATNPVGSMLASGLRIAGSSDSYITPLDPLGGMRAAMQHHNPAERVDFETAVRLFSSNAAYLAHAEGICGSIAPGYQADFTIIYGDRSLETASVAQTIKSGHCLYQATEH